MTPLEKEQRPRIKATDLRVEECQKMEAILYIRHHHSRLPNVQRGPWKYAFAAVDPDNNIVAAALWNNPSARTLPNEWIELRRMAVGPDAPHCTASMFLQRMVKQLRHYGHRHFISYQDIAVHTGTIYKAAGWRIEHTSEARIRQRGYSAARGRDYRTSINGTEPDAAPKNRWAVCYGCDSPACTHTTARKPAP
jgi:hypothetical protein